MTGHGSGMACLAPRIVSTGDKEASFKPPCHMPNGLGRLPREAESMEDHELPEDSLEVGTRFWRHSRSSIVESHGQQPSADVGRWPRVDFSAQRKRDAEAKLKGPRGER